MSVPSIPVDLLVFAALATVAIISSIVVVEHKSMVYAAFSLAILGIANAALFAFLGFPFVALFHLSVYVGAAVVFILFSITMLREAPLVDLPARSLALVMSVLVLLSFAAILAVGGIFEIPAATLVSGYRELANTFVTRFWFPLIIAALALIVTLIEAITLARKEVAV